MYVSKGVAFLCEPVYPQQDIIASISELFIVYVKLNIFSILRYQGCIIIYVLLDLYSYKCIHM